MLLVTTCYFLKAAALRGYRRVRTGRDSPHGSHGHECLVLTTGYLLPATSCLVLLTTSLILIATCYLLLATCYLLLATHYSPLTTYYPLLTTHYPLPTTDLPGLPAVGILSACHEALRQPGSPHAWSHLVDGGWPADMALRIVSLACGLTMPMFRMDRTPLPSALEQLGQLIDEADRPPREAGGGTPREVGGVSAGGSVAEIAGGGGTAAGMGDGTGARGERDGSSTGTGIGAGSGGWTGDGGGPCGGGGTSGGGDVGGTGSGVGECGGGVTSTGGEGVAVSGILTQVDELRSCVICDDALREVRFQCGHACCCDDCAALVASSGGECPICRGATHPVLARGAHLQGAPTFELPPRSSELLSNYLRDTAHLRMP